MIAKGSSGLKAYVGSTNVDKMYLGNTLVYENVDTTDYFALTASAASTVGVSGSYIFSLQYSTDKSSWNTFDSSVTISLNSGDTVYFRGTNARLGSSASVYTQFAMTGALSASGNIMSLLYNREINNKTTIPNTYCFAYLFYDCTALTSASALKLPATTLKNYCYYHMFQGCTSLTGVPVLPAMTITNYAYHSMFYGCTALTTAPALPATTLGTYCYNAMFQGCTSLTQAPVLSAMTTKADCYHNMFYGCTALTTAPALPATTLTANCYYNMFYNCSNLVTPPPVLPGTAAYSNFYRAMFRGCSKLTTTPKIMYTGASNTYSQREMFYGCSVLNWCMYLGTDISANNALYRWMYNVQTTSGIFVKNINAEWTTTGVSGVPTNWTVIYYDTADGKYYTDKTKAVECDDHGNIV